MLHCICWIIGFLGNAWLSPVTVDLLLCNMKLLYEDMSNEISVFLKN